MGKFLFNLFRVIMAVLMGAGLLAALELSLLKEHASSLNWTHLAISSGCVGVVLACMWDRNNSSRQ